jgi:hypothetical protein
MTINCSNYFTCILILKNGLRANLSLIFLVLGSTGFSQDFKKVNVNTFIGTTLAAEFGISLRTNEDLYISASSSQSTGNNSGGVLLAVNSNSVEEAYLLSDANGKELFITNFCRLTDRSLMVFFVTDDEPFPTVVINGKIYCAKFSEDLEFKWIYQIDTGINSTQARFLQCQGSDSGSAVFSFFGGDGYYLGCINKDGLLVWGHKLGFFPGTSNIIAQFNLSVFKDEVLFAFYQSSTNQSFVCKWRVTTG